MVIYVSDSNDSVSSPNISGQENSPQNRTDHDSVELDTSKDLHSMDIRFSPPIIKFKDRNGNMWQINKECTMTKKPDLQSLCIIASVNHSDIKKIQILHYKNGTVQIQVELSEPIKGLEDKLKQCSGFCDVEISYVEPSYTRVKSEIKGSLSTLFTFQKFLSIFNEAGIFTSDINEQIKPMIQLMALKQYYTTCILMLISMTIFASSYLASLFKNASHA